MNTPKLFETFSIIIKEEKVKTLTHNIIPNTFALEIITPLPGYYGSEFLISHKTPGNILLMTKDYIRFEDFYRILKKIRTYLEYKFDASAATVDLHNMRFNAIRIRNADSYEQIAEIQKAFIDEGFEMSKPRRIEDIALIRIKKFLHLATEDEGIFSDREANTYHYLAIDQSFSWKMFEKLTQRIRNNLSQIKFDVALGVLFRTGELQDVIRVYSENLSLDDLKALKAQYAKLMTEFQ